jgi:hypothetical protein
LSAEPACTAERQAAGVKCQIYSPNGVDPTYKTPKVGEWNLSVERQVAKDLMLRLGYNGSQGYHSMTNVDPNTIRPVVCNNPAGCVSGGVLAAAQRGVVPQGKTYIPVGTRPSPFVSNALMFFFDATSSYHGLDVTLTKRMSNGFSFRTNYTWSKSLDINSTPSGTAGTNSPQTVFTRYNLKLSRGVSSFSATNKFNANFSYELPFGQGRHFGANAGGVANSIIGGWQLNGIFTARDGFPYTPVMGSNRSGNGDARNPDVPDMNPSFNGNPTIGTVQRWFDPNQFALPIAGTFGDAGRGRLIGPGLINFDASLFKDFRITERWRAQFRFETFNLFNHANFTTPSPGVFSGTTIAPAAGRITSTSNHARELQFALRLEF